VNNPTYLNQYRRSLLAKQQELLAANGGRLVLGAAGGLVGADLMDQAFAEAEARVDARLSQDRSGMRRAIGWALDRLSKGNYGTGKSGTRASCRGFLSACGRRRF
jgi:RNA polymerase-binding transcription factor DksA